MDLNRAFEKAIKDEVKNQNQQGADALGRLHREYLGLLSEGIVTQATQTRPSPFGQRIKNYREDRDLTQEDVAQKARISLNTLQKLETGRTKAVRQLTLDRLSKAYELSPEESIDLLKFAAENSPQRRRRGPRQRN